MLDARPAWRNAALLLLVAVALFVRAVVPQGMMLQESAAGGIEIGICNSDATWTIPLKDSGPPSDDGGDQPQHCAFAGSPTGDAPPADLLALAHPLRLERIFAGFISAQAATASARQLPPARAPPILA